jgi:hypothetical protein
VTTLKSSVEQKIFSEKKHHAIGMAGLDMLFDFNAIAKTMPVVTAVVCFLSTQNMDS